MIAYEPNVTALRQIQEGLMRDTALVDAVGVPVIWPRTGTAAVPCRVGEERTFAEPSDPHDANVRAQAEWAVTLPWDFPVEVSHHIVVTLRTGDVLDLTVGEVNRPQSWLLASRAYATRQKSAVAPTLITFLRDVDNDGVFVEVSTYPTRVVFERNEPLETPVRFSHTLGTSYRRIRLVIEQPNADVQSDDTFVYAGMFGIVTAVIPGQPQQTEVIALLDFGGLR